MRLVAVFYDIFYEKSYKIIGVFIINENLLIYSTFIFLILDLTAW